MITVMGKMTFPSTHVVVMPVLKPVVNVPVVIDMGPFILLIFL
jgi:hypothetical protein